MRQPLINARDWMDRQPRSVLVAFSLLLIGLTLLWSYTVRLDFRFSFFYTLPIALTAWYVGRSAGVLFSFLSVAVWLGEVLAEHRSVKTVLKVAFWNAFILLSFYLILANLLSSLRQALDREKAAARADALTRLANRRAFFEQAEAEIQRTSRYGGRFSVMYMDLDNFKLVNDRDGHETGDRVLLLVADSLRKVLRVNDTVGRLGGDEFVVLLPQAGSDETDAVFQKLARQLANVMREGHWPVTLSAGAATFEKPPESAEKAVKLVDELMYAAKTGGKNRLEKRIVS